MKCVNTLITKSITMNGSRVEVWLVNINDAGLKSRVLKKYTLFSEYARTMAGGVSFTASKEGAGTQIGNRYNANRNIIKSVNFESFAAVIKLPQSYWLFSNQFPK